MKRTKETALNLPAKIVTVHHAMAKAELPHAFGGALALAWCTGRARGTIDIDINIFVDSQECERVFAALPPGVTTNVDDLKIILRDGQVRLWWEKTPLDIFLNTTDFHLAAAQRIRFETFMEEPLPFLSCFDLAVFKAFLNRTKDWADLEEMVEACTVDVSAVTAQIIAMLSVDDERVVKLQQL